MSHRLFLFQWQVPKDGVEWCDGPLVIDGTVAAEITRVLVPKKSDREVEYTSSYEPFVRESGLFLEFARLPIEEDAMLGFAEKYGTLCEQDRVSIPPAAGSRSGSKRSSRKLRTRRGDSLDRWVNHLLSMKGCVALWEAARQAKKQVLASVLVTVPRMEIADYLSSLVQLTQEGRLRPAAEYHCSPTSFGYTCNFGGQRIPLGAPGRCYVHHFTKLRTGPATLHEGGHLGFVLPAGRAPNSRLGGFGTTYPKDALGGNDPVGLARLLVTTEIARNLGQGVRPAIVPRPRTDWGDLRFAPRSLIEALWLQFAEAVCHDKDYRPCEVCGKPFEISPAVARTNRRLCSAGCKAKAYRLRKARVCRLWDRGITLTTIVRDSGSDEEQVQKWLAIHLRGKEQSLRSIAEQLGVTVYQVKKWTQKEGGK